MGNKSKENKRQSVDEKIAKMKNNMNGLEYNNAVLSNINNYKDADKIAISSGKPVEMIDVNLLDAAPIEWNFFPTISDSKMIEMIDSIMESGLFNPIIVWKQTSNRYMILSGHNRVNAYRNIVKVLNDRKDNSVNKFRQIPAIVYKMDELNELKAKEIIIDTNYVQRDDISKVLPTIVKERMTIVEKREGLTVARDVVNVVAEELGLSPTKVIEDNQIATIIIDEFKDKYFNYELTRKSILNLRHFDYKVQKWIYNEYKSNITSQMLLSLKKGDNKTQIREKFKKVINGPETISVSFQIPLKYRQEVLDLVNNYLLEIDANN